MLYTLSKKLNLNVPGAYSQIQYEMIVEWDNKEQLNKELDTFTADSLLNYQKNIIDIQKSLEAWDTQLTSHLESLQEQIKWLQNKLEDYQDLTLLLNKDDVKKASEEVKKSASYKKRYKITD